MLLLVRQEWYKLWRRFSPYVIFLIIVLLVSLIVFGFKRHPPFEHRRHRMEQTGSLMVMGSPLNGLFICHFMLLSIAHTLPFLVPVVVGEILGGEGAAGTLRMILVRPRSRFTVWTAKWLTALLYTVAVCLFTMLVSLLIGLLVFGRGQLWPFEAMQDRKLVILSEQEGFAYLALAYLMLSVSVFITASLAMMLSSFMDSALVPGFTVLAVVFTLTIISALPFDWVETAKPWFFTTYLGDYKDAFPTEFDPQTLVLKLPLEQIWQSLRASLGFIGLFSGVGLWRFLTRDVTC
jgi:ABC-2 type transport system permease protein